MTRTRSEVVAAARASISYTTRMCMQWTRVQAGLPAVGDFDGDGAADAEDGWKASVQKHPGDRKPPAGTFPWWGGGSADNGHVNVSLGPDKNGQYWVRGIDTPTKGLVGTVPLEWVEENWGLPYMGWTPSIGQHVVPEDAPAPIVELTRGRLIDEALNKLKKAKGKPVKMAKVKAAILALQSIRPYKKR